MKKEHIYFVIGVIAAFIIPPIVSALVSFASNLYEEYRMRNLVCDGSYIVLEESGQSFETMGRKHVQIDYLGDSVMIWICH